MNGGSDSLEQFKSRLPLADIVGRYVKLTRRGREHQGLCPFHSEKTPSFSVVESKGFYHCFGCGAHGDAISFVMAIEGLSFPDALTRLSDITGVPAPRKSSSEPRIDPGLLDANAAASRYFSDSLASARAEGARQYIASRKIGFDAVSHFAIGFAGSSRHGLKDWLKDRGIGEELAVEAGLLVRPEGGGDSFDRFRDRLMIPIEDSRGRVVGFGGRALAGQKAKYLNSPETPVFHKGELLYNLKSASVPARQNGRLLVVEGYMDVIALHENNLPEAVAPLGTAVTEEQLKLLWRVCDAPCVCLDGDRAGRAAALRLARKALAVMKSGLSLSFVVLPEGEDPDSLVRSGGPQAMEGMMRTSIPLSRLIWLEEVQAGPPDNPEAFAGLRHRLMGYAEATTDPNLRQALKDQFFALLDSRRPKKTGPGSRYGQGKIAYSKSSQWEGSGSRLGVTVQNPAGRSEARLLAYFLSSPELLDHYADHLAAISFDDEAVERARQEILNWYSTTPSLDAGALAHHLTRHGHERIAALAERAASGIGGDRGGDAGLELEALLRTLLSDRAELESRDELARDIEGRNLAEVEAKREALDQLVNRGGEGADGWIDGEAGRFKR